MHAGNKAKVFFFFKKGSLMLWVTPGCKTESETSFYRCFYIECKVFRILLPSLCRFQENIKYIYCMCLYICFCAGFKDTNESLFSVCRRVWLLIRVYIEMCYFTSTWILCTDKSRTKSKQGHSVTGHAVVFVKTPKERLKLHNDQ